MKIAHIVCTYPPYYGGMGNTAFQMVSYLSALGHEVVAFTPQYNINVETKETEERKEYAKRLKSPITYGNAAYMPTIAKELDDFDLVHLHYPFFGTANLVRKWKLKNPHKPLVVTYHMDTRGNGLKGFVFKMYAKFWMPKILGVADKILVSSFDYIEHSDASKFYLANKEKFEELPFGVDIEKFSPRNKSLDLFVQNNLQSDLSTILFVGGMDVAHYFKGVEVLLKAVYLLKNSGLQFQVILVGEGELKKEYELKTKGMGLEDIVRFVGSVSNEELPYYYNLADVLVLPSINTAEAFGIVLLEAMASGVPVIASDLPGVRTVAKDGGEIFAIKKYEELAGLLSDYFAQKKEIPVWKKQVRQVAESKYSWEKIIKKLDFIYSELVNRS